MSDKILWAVGGGLVLAAGVFFFSQGAGGGKVAVPAPPPPEPPPAAVPAGAPASAGAAVNALAFSLAGRLPREGNLFYSPYSVYAALSLSQQGAQGQTASELDAALFGRWDIGKLTESLNALGSRGEVVLSAANALWAAEDVKLKKSFTDIVGSAARRVDFKDPRAVGLVNAWVSENTRGKIPTLFSRFDPTTRVVLANAVYFKGDWADVFQKRHTAPEAFKGLKGSFEVPLMRDTRHARYAEDAEAQWLELPYKGGEVVAVFALPKEGPVSALQSGLDHARFAAARAALEGSEVSVYLPPFKLDASYALVEPLKALGVRRAFEDSAEFGLMVEGEPVKIDQVVHKAMVALDEQGTEAAAATGMSMLAGAAAHAPPKVFRADRPFLFFIVDKATGAILFLGRIEDPRG